MTESSSGVVLPIPPSLHWVDGGSLSRWGAVHSKAALPLGTEGQKARFMFTKVGPSTADPAVQKWAEHLKALGLRTNPRDTRVFWRLVVRQRSIALCARPATDVPTALEDARHVTGRAAALQVRFAFFPGEPIPRWVVFDGEVPVFIGLPQHHLVRIADPRVSLAAVLAQAAVKSRVHEVGGRIEDLGPAVMPAPRSRLR